MSSVINISREGDVILQVWYDHKCTWFRVSSQVLVASSPAFTAMLGPSSPYLEAVALRNPARCEPVQIALEDAHPDAVQIILNVIHLRNSYVPQALEFCDMYEVAKLCD
ncbi:hypothetical protein K440DRAFT_644998 [Wilcoxina mikolae CBS 423.85]|nr:hypothetical protein K440DRAFT_644998 [Wilcoxina mikolae CBS 423.85]